jgi:hypothetical protein
MGGKRGRDLNSMWRFHVEAYAARKVLNVFCPDIAIYKNQTERRAGLVRTQDSDVG